MLKTLLVTGDHPRHLFIANRIANLTNLSACFLEPRGPIIPSDLDDLPLQISSVAKQHYEDRALTEMSYTNENQSQLVTDLPVVEFRSWDDFNARLIFEKPDLVISFGCSKIPDHIIANPEPIFINFHGGLSPWYKGTMTTFWPSFFLDPEKTGYTIHKTTSKIDAGEVLARCATELDLSLSINGLAKSATLALSAILPELFHGIESGRMSRMLATQKSSGRLFRNSDWHPAHLVPIYTVQENRPLAYVSQFRDIIPFNS